MLGSVKSFGGIRTWLELQPYTGRTHQLRVHAAALGCPIVGDQLYGNRIHQQEHTLMLHAQAVALPLYSGRKPIRLTALPPDHMIKALLACGFTGAGALPRTLP